MSLTYTIYNSEADGAGATLIFSDNTVQQISDAHPNFQKVVLILTTTPKNEIDEDAVRNLVLPAFGVGKTLTRLSERVSFDGSNVLFDGDIVDDAIGKHIVRIIAEGGSADSYKALVAFMEKLYTNPSQHSRENLYDFIVNYGITIDPDGDFYAYKGVNADSTSKYSGFGIVDGVAMHGHLPNKPGSVVEMPRTQVEQDKSVGCAVGLHAGTYDYASRWANGMLLLVKINPRDVVSVPSDHTFAKIRTCRYKVVQQTVQQVKATTFTPEAQTDLDNVAALSIRTKAGEKVQTAFTFTRGNGSRVGVEGLVTAVRNAPYDKNESILEVEDADGNTRFYPLPYVSDLSIKEDPATVTDGTVHDAVKVAQALAVLRERIANGEEVTCNIETYSVISDTHHRRDGVVINEIDTINEWREILVEKSAPDKTPEFFRVENLASLTIVDVKESEEQDSSAVKAVSGTAAWAVLRAALNMNETIVCDFNYTTMKGEPRTVEDFSAEELRTVGSRAELLVGERRDGETRSYRVERITDLIIKGDFDEDDESEAEEADPLVSLTVVPVRTAPAPVQDFQWSAGQTPVETLTDMLNGDYHGVPVSFSYTTIQGEVRSLVGFVAQRVENTRNGGILVGQRSDGEWRSYRLDRVTDLTINQMM